MFLSHYANFRLFSTCATVRLCVSIQRTENSRLKIDFHLSLHLTRENKSFNADEWSPNLAASLTALGLMCKKQTSFNSALHTLSTDEVYEMYCLLEALQQNKENLLPRV